MTRISSGCDGLPRPEIIRQRCPYTDVTILKLQCRFNAPRPDWHSATGVSRGVQVPDNRLQRRFVFAHFERRRIEIVPFQSLSGSGRDETNMSICGKRWQKAVQTLRQSDRDGGVPLLVQQFSMAQDGAHGDQQQEECCDRFDERGRRKPASHQAASPVASAAAGV